MRDLSPEEVHEVAFDRLHTAVKFARKILADVMERMPEAAEPGVSFNATAAVRDLIVDDHITALAAAALVVLMGEFAAATQDHVDLRSGSTSVEFGVDDDGAVTVIPPPRVLPQKGGEQ